MGLQETEEEIKIEDLSIDMLVPQLNTEGNIPFIGNFIMLGFPKSEIQINKLKEYGLGFDRVIFLNDTSEEEPGKALRERCFNRKKNDI